jgi:hypothetical protein
LSCFFPFDANETSPRYSKTGPYRVIQNPPINCYHFYENERVKQKITSVTSANYTRTLHQLSVTSANYTRTLHQLSVTSANYTRRLHQLSVTSANYTRTLHQLSVTSANYTHTLHQLSLSISGTNLPSVSFFI